MCTGRVWVPTVERVKKSTEVTLTGPADWAV
jgi:hypothetical protein